MHKVQDIDSLAVDLPVIGAPIERSPEPRPFGDVPEEHQPAEHDAPFRRLAERTKNKTALTTPTKRPTAAKPTRTSKT